MIIERLLSCVTSSTALVSCIVVVVSVVLIWRHGKIIVGTPRDFEKVTVESSLRQATVYVRDFRLSEFSWNKMLDFLSRFRVGALNLISNRIYSGEKHPFYVVLCQFNADSRRSTDKAENFSVT